MKKIRRRILAVISAALMCSACAATTPGRDARDILTPSSRIAHWPVEGESRPGIWIRLQLVNVPVSTRELIDSLRIIVDHNGSTQVLTGAAFSLLPNAGDTHQTRYFYTPTSGVMFVTLRLRGAGTWFFPDTQRIELNDDCWHMLNYTVRRRRASDQPTPPPYPRTTILTPTSSSAEPLYLEVFLSGNCFKNRRPPS